MESRYGYLKLLSILSLLCWVVACGSAGVKDGDGKAAKPTLKDTVQYLPVQKYDDKTAAYLAYEPAVNPYVVMKGRIHKDAVTKFIEVRRLLKAGRNDQVDALLNEIIALDGSLAGPWLIKGDIALGNNQREDALAHYKKAIEVNKSNVNAYLKLAKVQRVLGQFIEAQNTYAAALEVWPDFPEAHLNVAILYDIYLNHPLRAQKHMEAYLFLVDEPEQKFVTWLDEVKSRTGVTASSYQL